MPNKNNSSSLPYKISHDPTEEISPQKEELFYHLREQAKKGKRGIVEKLIKNIKKYPGETCLKNYLYTAHKMRGRHDAARKVLDQTIKLHPDYLFGKLNLAEEYIVEKKFAKVPEVLGKTLELEALYPDQDTFHISEVISFFATTATYFMEIGDLKEAGRRLKVIGKIAEPDHPTLKYLTKQLTARTLLTNMERMREQMSATITVDSFPTVKYEATTEPPVLQHEMLRAFYQQGIEDFTTELIPSIMALPRASLIQDLELIVKDCIKRVDWFQDHYSEYVEEEQVFQTHALYFLGALKSSESLPVILDLLRQGEDFLVYWFGDEMEAIFGITLYSLCQNSLPRLKQFVLEPYIYWPVRLVVATTVAQMALHQPERKEEVITWFKEIFQYHLDHPDKEGIIDTNFIAWAVSKFYEVDAIEDISLIQKLWDKEWIPEHILGDFATISEKAKKSREDHDKDPMPRDINEFYSGAYLDRRIKRPLTPEDKRLMEEIDDDMKNNPIFRELTNMMGMGQAEPASLFDEYTEEYNETEYLPDINTSIKSGKKVGRNEPCPCGSGKKYKKCCLNK